MSARREVVSAVMERYRSAKRAEKGRMLDALCATTGWHRKHAVRALRRRATVGSGEVEAHEERKRRYGATIKDAMTALWEASDRVCGKRLKVMIPTLLPALEQHGRLQLGQADRDCVLAISPATIDGLLVDGGIVHPDPDDGRCRHGLDGVPAVVDAGRFAGRRGDQSGTEPVPLVVARGGLR